MLNLVTILFTILIVLVTGVWLYRLVSNGQGFNLGRSPTSESANKVPWGWQELPRAGELSGAQALMWVNWWWFAGSVQKPVLFTCSHYCNLFGFNLDRIMPSQIKIKPRPRAHVEMKSESKSLGTKLKPQYLLLNWIAKTVDLSKRTKKSSVSSEGYVAPQLMPHPEKQNKAMPSPPTTRLYVHATNIFLDSCLFTFISFTNL